uniref:mitogen-activated protein kinase n=1 Tax=Araucaria cunninghamii TaxID=56994 RepID=A0A0D6QXK6_ARACU
MGGGAIVDSVRRWWQRRWNNNHQLVSEEEKNTEKEKITHYKSNNNENDETKNSASTSACAADFASLALEESEGRGLKPVRVQNRSTMAGHDRHRKSLLDTEFFTEYGEANRYQIQEVVGKGSYGVVGSAIDTHTGERVAIKKINDVFEHVSDATRILREIKLLRLLRHPDVVEIKHIMLPPSRREFKDIYVVFELMESDLHQVIKANDDLTPEHYQFFLYQLLRALKYIHTANVFHRDLKPKNILANADCKLKICDFGLARVSFNDAPSAIFWTDYVATRWYRAPELCGSFFSKYTPAIDIWSIGCIFAEMLTGKPLFPGKNVVHQLDLMTDLLGTPSAESTSRIRNEKARRYLSSMRRKQPIPFSQKFPNADPLALRLLERLLAFDPKDRPTAEEALADPYFKGLAKVEREPSTQPISKLEFEFERRRLTKDDVRELIYREILEYHPQMLKEYLCGGNNANFMYPSAVDMFKRQFAHLEEHYGKGERSTPLDRQHASLPRERVIEFREDTTKQDSEKQQGTAAVTKASLQSPPRAQGMTAQPSKVIGSGVSLVNGASRAITNPRSLVKSSSISASQCSPAVNAYQKKKLNDET